MWRWKAVFTAVHLLSLGDRHIQELSGRASDVLSFDTLLDVPVINKDFRLANVNARIL